MTISRESAAVVLRLLTGAFPSPALGEDSVGLYLDRMTSPPFGDVDLLLAVAEACIDELDRMPTLHQLLVAYQGAARAKISQRMAADQRALERAGATSGGPRPDEGYGKAMVGVIRTALGEAIPAGDGARGHRHEPGVDPTVGREVYTLDGPQVVGRCPVCSNADAVAEAMAGRMAELLAERHVVPIPQPVKVSRCSSCGDDGVVVVGVHPEFTTKPCAACRPEATEAWANGELGVRRGVTR